MFDTLSNLSNSRAFDCARAIEYYESNFNNADILRVIKDNVDELGENVFVLADANFSKDTVRYLVDFMKHNESDSRREYWKEINMNVAADLRNRGKLNAEQYDYIISILEVNTEDRDAFDEVVEKGLSLSFTYLDTVLFTHNFINNAFMPYLVMYPKIGNNSKHAIMSQTNQFLAQYLFRWCLKGYTGDCLKLFADAWNSNINPQVMLIENSTKTLKPNYDVMYELLEAAKHGIDMSKYKDNYRFNASQIHVIWSGKSQNLDVSKFDKEAYPAWLMYVISLGLMQGVDISESAPQINSVKEGQDLIEELLYR